MTSILKGNIYLHNLGAKILHSSYVKKKNYFFKASEQLDFIGKDIDRLSNLIKQYKSNTPDKNAFISNNIYGESKLYGHLRMLMDYASISRHMAIYLPIIEHGVHFDVYKNCTENLSKIEEGDYGKLFLHKQYPGTPIFSIGPYIHYAKQFYSDFQIDELKKRLGKVLLVFPSHSHELVLKQYDQNNFLDQVYSIGKKFDTILFCAYWNDLNNDFFQGLLKADQYVVSAGLRGAENFINKLKTIITISDEVVVNDLTSGIGYFIYMKKKLHFVNSNVKAVSLHGEKQTSIYSNLFLSFVEMFQDEMKNSNESLFNLIEPFWGFTKLKTPEQIQKILQINRRIILRAKGKKSFLADSAKKELEYLERADSEESKEEYVLLKEAIS